MRKRSSTLGQKALADAEAIAKGQTPPSDKAPSERPSEAAEKASPSVFATAEDQSYLPRAPNLKKGFHEIAQRIFDDPIEIQKEFDTIEGSLSIKGALTPQVIATAANQTEDMARRAYRLYICAKVEYEAYMRETEAIVAACREAAVARLEKQKAQKIRTKQITDSDVLNQCATQFPDEWEDVNNRRDRAKGMLKYLEQLSSLANTRCFTVAKMMNPSGQL